MIYNTRNILLSTALSSLLAAPALAGTFTPPEGCTPWLTVQMRSCKVSNHYTCENDAQGDKWRVDFGINGAYFRSRIDYETQWVESHNSDGIVELLEPNPADPASFSELLETGLDSYDFSQMKSDGVRENIKGYDRLTGESVVIDGVTLLRTKYDAEIRYDDGTLAWKAQGSEFIHPEWRIFLSGTGQVQIDGNLIPKDFTPVDFVFPGEPGFMETIPTYDCESITAQNGSLLPAAYKAPDHSNR